MWIDDYKPEFLRRLKANYYLSENETDRGKVMRYYASHCVEWIEDWCITFDPRVEPPLPKMMPFKLFPRQREFVQFILSCLHEKEDGLCEKSRDMGITWICCAISVWLWIFHKGSVIGFGSVLAHNIDDRGNPKAIFLKIRQIIANLPRWMRPPGYIEKWHAPAMKVLHPSDSWNSSIIGEGGTNVGRGGRTSLYFKDESAHYEQPELIEASLSENTNVQIDVSSVNGTNNPFYRRRMAGEIWYPDKPSTPGIVRVFIFDWSDNPLKSREWYEKRKNKYDREGLAHVFAQEVDRDYSGSQERIIIPAEWVNAAVDAHKKLGFEPSGLKIAGQDVADGGADRNALAVRYGVVLIHAQHWGGQADDAPTVTIPICKEMGVNELYYDSIGVGAGFKAAINNMRKNDLTYPKSLKIHPWDAGAEVLDPERRIIPGDKESPLNKDQYYNLKAQAWFRLRARFSKTFRMLHRNEKYPLDELISLDSSLKYLHELKTELSQPQSKARQDGKVLVDKKPDGAVSPNLADAICMCYCPAKAPAGLFT